MYQIIKKGDKYAIRRKILGLFWMYLTEEEMSDWWWFWPNETSWFTKQSTAEGLIGIWIKRKAEKRAFRKATTEVAKDV